VAPSDLLADGEELVAGRRPVEEAFVAHRPARRLLVVPQRRQALERLVLHATSLRIPVVEVEGGTLTAVAGFDGHQGIALVVEPRTFAGIDDILARAVERNEPPFVLVLDSLEDPQNVGTLLRSAEAAGVHGVLFPTRRQAPLSPAAVKASAGAVEHLLLCPVDDLPAALSDLRIRGLRIAAAEAEAPLTTAEADLRGPIAIIVGSEGQGLSPTVRRRADVAVRIPMRGAIGSLNAAVAGSILLFAAVAQRDPTGDGATRRPRPPSFDELAGSTASAEAAPAAASEPILSTEAAAEPDAPEAVSPPRRTRRAAAKATDATPGTSKSTPDGANAVSGPAVEPPKPPRTPARAKATSVKKSARQAAPRSSGRRARTAVEPDASAIGPESTADELLPGGPDPD
jgi:23S rRNA (guanosine2251-2'-O)-methyltransferase